MPEESLLRNAPQCSAAAFGNDASESWGWDWGRGVDAGVDGLQTLVLVRRP